jgi:uncharacterized membrane protein
MGVTNFIGFLALLRALSAGPLSIIISITGLYFVIAIMLSVLFYGERLNVVRVSGMLLALISLILMKL